MKVPVLVAVPSGVVTEMVPLVALAGTVKVRLVLLTGAKVAAVPFRATAVAPVRSVPVTVTVVPTGPLAGVKLVIVGAAATVAAWSRGVNHDAEARPGQSMSSIARQASNRTEKRCFINGKMGMERRVKERRIKKTGREKEYDNIANLGS